MPLVFVQRYAPSAGVATGTGVQYVNGTLTLENPTYVDFDPVLWAGASPGDSAVIFEFTTLSPAGAASYLVAGDLPPGVSGASFSQVGSTIVVTFS